MLTANVVNICVSRTIYERDTKRSSKVHVPEATIMLLLIFAFLAILSSRSVHSSAHLQLFRILTIPFQLPAVNTDKPYVLPFPLHLSSYLYSLF
jgi:hypothetical protein